MNIPDEYEMPPEVFQRFLIPLSYEKTLAHCQAYHIKTNILVCLKDLWVKKIEKITINERQELFHYSVDKGYTLLVQALLEDENVDPADDDNYAVELAAANGHTNVVKLLLADPRVNPADNGNAAIRFATKYGYVDVVKLLLADPRVDPAAKYNDAIRSAARYGYKNIVKLLLADQRVNPTDKDNNAI